MPKIPPPTLVQLIHEKLSDLLTSNPAATSSEAYVRNHMEFKVIDQDCDPHYYLRIGINYHGDKVQHLQTDKKGVLIGWNPKGDALHWSKCKSLTGWYNDLRSGSRRTND